MKMKIRFTKLFFTFFVIGIFFSSAVFANNKKDIGKILTSYEEFVIEAENAAKKNNLTALMKLQMKSLEFAEKVEKLETSSDWTAKDLEKYTDLTLRYTKAMSKMSGSF